jgi:hypothetical protein
LSVPADAVTCGTGRGVAPAAGSHPKRQRWAATIYTNRIVRAARRLWCRTTTMTRTVAPAACWYLSSSKVPQTIPAPENVTKREADPVLGLFATAMAYSACWATCTRIFTTLDAEPLADRAVRAASGYHSDSGTGAACPAPPVLPEPDDSRYGARARLRALLNS